MDNSNFRDYIEKVFHPCLVKQGVKFQVLLFVDAHVSHKSIEVAEQNNTMLGTSRQMVWA